jgi:hypothetical protein
MVKRRKGKNPSVRGIMSILLLRHWKNEQLFLSREMFYVHDEDFIPMSRVPISFI